MLLRKPVTYNVSKLRVDEDVPLIGLLVCRRYLSECDLCRHQQRGEAGEQETRHDHLRHEIRQ